MGRVKKKLKEILKQFYRNILKVLPTKMVLYIETFRGYHKILNLKKPKYFGEKIQWIKLYGNLEKYTNLVDKFEVRNHIESKIGKKYLTKIIAVYDKPEEINFDLLPEKFVLKLNTGSGYNIICSNKNEIDVQQVVKTLNKWLKEDYYKIKKENQYKNIKKKIMCEEFLEDKNGELLDYKFYCFNGKVELIEVDFDRFENHTMNFYDRNWNLLNLHKGNYKNYLGPVEKPKKIEEMISIAEKLSEELSLARIDLYYVDDKIYFGEITLTPAGGLTSWTPIQKDIELAAKIDLKQYISKKILYVGRISSERNILDGVTIKARVLKEKLEDGKHIIETIDVDNWKNHILSLSVNLLKKYKTCDEIVICSSSPGAAIVLRFLHLIKNKKKVYYFVSGGMLAKLMKDKKYKYPLKIYKNLDKIYVESEKMKKDFYKLGLHQTEVMFNFRNPKISFEDILKTENKIKFVFYGRVVKEKGIEEAIKLINKLNEKNYEVELDIYGQVNDEYLKYLNLDKYQNINYKGALVPNGIDEYKCLHNYDIFLFPTEHVGEGLPGALIDSYISGLCVVASNWEYAKEYIKNNENGIIFEYKNYDDMFYKVEELISKKELIDKYKKESLNLYKNYIIDYIIPKELVGDVCE